MRMSHWALLVGAVALMGCGQGGNQTGGKPAGAATGQADSGAMGMRHMDSAGMQMTPGESGGMGMGRGMPGMQMISGMRAHMDSMMHMPPEQMRAMMTQHEAMMSQMLDQMGRDMRSMHMTGNAQWNALTDSVKSDLAELPNLQGKALAERMRAYAARVTRLTAMHEAMMKSMPGR